MTEFVLVLPITMLLVFGLFLAGFYVFRAAQADYAVFLSGVATGAYKEPATQKALNVVTNPDIRSAVNAGSVDNYTVRSSINIGAVRLTVLGVEFYEAQRGSATFRLWRFRPGPPR